jgi:hypothetical protein
VSEKDAIALDNYLQEKFGTAGKIGEPNNPDQ